MLDIIWGRENAPEFVLDTRIWFSRHKKPEWFENEFVKRFLKDIDGSTVLFQEALSDYRGRGISTEMISTGCKTLCDIYFCEDDTIFYGSAMGDNCLPFLIEIAQKKDVTIVLEHYADFEESAFQTGLIRSNGVIMDQDSYDDAFSDWSASTLEDDYLDRLYSKIHAE